MEDLSDLGRRGHPGAASARRPSLLPSSSMVSVQVYTVPSSSAAGGEVARAHGGVAPTIHASSSVTGHGGRAADLDPIKAKIVSHPRYHRLLAAFLDCHKVGCPPEAAEEITAAAREREAWQRAAAGDAHARPDPELDQFMVEYRTKHACCLYLYMTLRPLVPGIMHTYGLMWIIRDLEEAISSVIMLNTCLGFDMCESFYCDRQESYCELLVAWKEELTRPLREAKEFLTTVELQLNSITNNTGPTMGAVISSAAEDKTGVDMSDDDQEEGSGGMELAEAALGMDPCSDDKELKKQLLRKYSGCLGNLRKELCKKRKKGKLPKEARQKLLSWWELHYRWPYPSEMDKIALAESTGLEQKQINNWFINQRKRHWKPSEEMQFAVMDGFHPAPPNAAALYVDARLVAGATPAMFYARPDHGAHGIWHN